MDEKKDKKTRRRKRKPVPDGSRIPKEVLDQLLAGVGGKDALTDPSALLQDLTAALVSRALESELDHHLGYEAGEEPPTGQVSRRKGSWEQSLRTGHGEVEIRTPRDRGA